MIDSKIYSVTEVKVLVYLAFQIVISVNDFTIVKKKKSFLPSKVK